MTMISWFSERKWRIREKYLNRRHGKADAGLVYPNVEKFWREIEFKWSLLNPTRGGGLMQETSLRWKGSGGWPGAGGSALLSAGAGPRQMGVPRLWYWHTERRERRSPSWQGESIHGLVGLWPMHYWAGSCARCTQKNWDLLNKDISGLLISYWFR